MVGGETKMTNKIKIVSKIIRAFLTVLGISLGIGTMALLESLNLLGFLDGFRLKLFGYVGIGLIFGIIFFILSPKIMKLGQKIISIAEGEIQKIPASDIIIGVVGLVLGLVIANLLSPLFRMIPYVGPVLSILFYILFGYFGVVVPTRKKEDFTSALSSLKKSGGKEKASKTGSVVLPKILDTSVIIDGRIADICKTGFVEGPLVIPEFVLEELQRIADSSDSLKRNRGRRGLDILNKIQKELEIEVVIHEKDFEDIAEVDTKLLKLAQFIKGKVVTNDYNLNKVAEFHGVEVLNINELANAIKPVVLPGEEMMVQVIKDGKESGQGVAYLDDGTMIVVDGGKKHIGDTIGVLVTSVLQTAAGRMIFAKPKSMTDKAV